MRRGAESSWVEVPAQPTGVYALMWQGRVVYVGQSVNVMGRLSQHTYRLRRWRKGWMPKVGEPPVIQFDRIFVKYCREEELDRLECELVRKYNPDFNVMLKQYGTPFEISLSELGLDVRPGPGKKGRDRPTTKEYIREWRQMHKDEDITLPKLKCLEDADAGK